MYLHIGQSVLIPVSHIVGIFDLDNTTSSPRTREFLNRGEKEGKVHSVSPEELPKSFLVCTEEGGTKKIYLSPLATSTLLRRLANPLGQGEIS